jgi:hypothetical protein
VLPPLSLTVAWPCLLKSDAPCPESFRMALPRCPYSAGS